MQLKALRFFVRIAHSGSVVDAAAFYNLPSSTLSRAMAQLQREVRQPLFERYGRSIRLTVQGNAFLRKVEVALQTLDEASADAQRVGMPVALTLGIINSLGRSVAPNAMRRYLNQQPDAKIRLWQGATDTMLGEQLAEGVVDLALTFAKDLNARFACRPVSSEEFVLIFPPSHRFSSRRALGLTACAKEPFVLLKRSSCLRSVTDDLFAKTGIEPPVAYEVDDVDTLQGLVAVGLGVAVVPRYSLGGVDKLTVVEISSSDRYADLMLVWNVDRALPPIARAFRDLLTKNVTRFNVGNGAHESVGTT